MNSQQRFYLDALGIQLWEQRDALPSVLEAAACQPRAPEALAAAAPLIEVEAKVITPAPEARVAAPAVELAARSQQADDVIPAYLDEAPPPELPMPGMEADGYFDAVAGMPEPVAAKPDAVSRLDWPALQQRVSACLSCPELVANRSQTVFGTGNPQADWMIIDEAPGAEEDTLGEPFAGQPGQLLNAMLQALGLKRQQVDITNMIKCRTPNNRDPKREEVAACEVFLKRQIALVQPRVILVVGRIAAQTLLNVDTPIGKLRGRVHQYEGNIPLVVTYQPAYLLRSPLEKRKSWADLWLAQSVINGGG
jgi:DNA polymerase